MNIDYIKCFKSFEKVKLEVYLNLPSNGHTVRKVVGRLAALQDHGFGRWLAGTVAFPSTMVDRIVPATTGEDRTRIAASLGLHDAWPVVSCIF